MENQLHLILKGKWYDMIASGVKPEEYRDLTEYWIKRLLILTKDGEKICHYFGRLEQERIINFKDYSHVCFHRGYTSTTMIFEIEGFTIGKGNPEWGAPEDMEVFIIKLGKQI
jgi:hypothetical protein